MIDKIPILKLIPGAFVLIIGGILLSSAVSFYWVSELANSSNRIDTLRTPTLRASSKMVNHINVALSALRGWMLLGEFRFDKALRDA